MDPERLKKVSHKLSWLLRHGAAEAGLTMDAAGWAPVEEVLRRLRLSRGELDAAVAGNNKSRYEVAGERVRASQGHSLGAGMPVTQEALEASWSRYAGDDLIWHGTRAAVVPEIAASGILRGGRSHVHLADGLSSRVGKRASVEVMLGVSASRLRAAGEEVWVSPNGVVLARHVPPGCVVALEAMTRRSRGEEASLRASLGLAAGR